MLYDIVQSLSSCSLHAAAESLHHIVAMLEGVAVRWEFIGIFLGIHYNYIERLGTENYHLEDKVTSMVGAWLARRYDVEEFGEPTMRRLVEAVGSKSGGNNRSLAADIAKKYRTSEFAQAARADC